jgi:hypothetical protein
MGRLSTRAAGPDVAGPLGALNHRSTTMLVICKAREHKRHWSVGESRRAVRRPPARAGPVDPLALLEVRLGGLPAMREIEAGDPA